MPSTARNGTAVKSEPLPTSPETKPPDEPSSSPTPEKKPDVGGDAIDGRLRVVKVKPENTSEINRCVITVSDESLTLRKNGSPRAVIIGLEGDGDIDGITAVSSSPQNVSVRRELIEGVKTRALFVVGSISKKAGLYQIKFDLPCGKKEVFVKVQ